MYADDGPTTGAAVAPKFKLIPPAAVPPTEPFSLILPVTDTGIEPDVDCVKANEPLSFTTKFCPTTPVLLLVAKPTKVAELSARTCNATGPKLPAKSPKY